MSLHKIQGAPGFTKDLDTGVVINNNKANYLLLLEKRKHKREMDAIKSQIDKLEQLVKVAIK